MGKKSYDNGKKFEEELCDYFSNQGYYVIYNEKGITGAQPCDIVIIKNNIATLVEAKNLDNKSGLFNLERVEENQRMAFRHFKKCKNSNFILAIKWNNKVWFIDFDLLQFYDKHINLKLIKPLINNFNEEITNES